MEVERMGYLSGRYQKFFFWLQMGQLGKRGDFKYMNFIQWFVFMFLVCFKVVQYYYKQGFWSKVYFGISSIFIMYQLFVRLFI